MLRKTLTTLSLIGLLLSVSLWGAAYHGLYFLDRHVVIVASHYSVRLHWHLMGSAYNSAILQGAWVHANPGHIPRNRWFPTMESRTLASGNRVVSCHLPLWAPTLVFALLPVCLLTPIYRRRKRRKLGLCSNCGYNLRGSTARCPECNLTFDAAFLEELRWRAERGRARMARWLVRVNRSTVRKGCVVVALLCLLFSVGVWVAQSIRPIHLYSSFDTDAIPHHPLLAQKVYDLKKANTQVEHTIPYQDLLSERTRQPSATFLMIGAGQGYLQLKWLGPTPWVDIMEEGTTLRYRYPVRATEVIRMWVAVGVVAIISGCLAAIGPGARRKLRQMERCPNCSHDLSDCTGPSCPECERTIAWQVRGG